MLICRFLLNLRQADNPQSTTAMSRLSAFSASGFRVPQSHSILGNLGEPLEWGYSRDGSVEEDREERIVSDDFDHTELNQLSLTVPSTTAETQSPFLPRTEARFG